MTSVPAGRRPDYPIRTGPVSAVLDDEYRVRPVSGTAADEADQAEIAAMVQTFFAAFTSDPDCVARLEAMRELFLVGAVIVRTCGLEPTVYDLDGFIAPRQELLTSGVLSGFREWQLSGHTEVFGDIAQHFCSYAKCWVQDGRPITGRGMKTLQFVRTAGGWRISAAAWDDERDGLALPLD